MLLEIRCKEFKDEDNVREPIVFHPGLNTIMGASRASNSIGKTTFLLVIDFVFGGRDYVMLNNDVTKNVGEHSVEFAFKFGEDIYRFSVGGHSPFSCVHAQKKQDSVVIFAETVAVVVVIIVGV